VNDSVSQVIAAVIMSGEKGISAGIAEALLDTLVEPVITIPLRTLLFFILFAIICLCVSFFAKRLAIINRIPLIGRVNSILGGATGLLKAAVIIMLICMGLNILITVTDNTIIFINTMTIEETFIFRHIYNFELIKFGS